MSSAYSRALIAHSHILVPQGRLSVMSFKKRDNKRVLSRHPCFTPASVVNQSESYSPPHTAARLSVYKLCRTLKNVVDRPILLSL